MSKFTLKPADGKSVRDPRTMKQLAAEGEQKPRSSYWLRRVACGDVVIVEPTKTARGKKR